MTPLFPLQDRQNPFPLNFQLGRASIGLAQGEGLLRHDTFGDSRSMDPANLC
jgi:hypothetical protein